MSMSQIVVAQSVKHLSSAQIMVSGSWDGAVSRASCSAGTPLLSLSLSLLKCAHVRQLIHNTLYVRGTILSSVVMLSPLYRQVNWDRDSASCQRWYHWCVVHAVICPAFIVEHSCQFVLHGKHTLKTLVPTAVWPPVLISSSLPEPF